MEKKKKKKKPRQKPIGSLVGFQELLKCERTLRESARK
jgi:hypothetical protein